MKRAFDIAVAAVLLVILAPLFLIIGCMLLLSGSGPVIFRSPRVGRYGRTFHMLKFRTMTPNPAIKTEVTVAGDTRITKIGRVLRATKLDELPQLINVLRGEMSLVGPRPEAPRYVAYYTPEQRKVLSVRPGITGLSQVVFRYEERLLTGADPEQRYLTVVMPSKLAIDLEYVRNHSLWRDLRILGVTLVALLRPPAQRHPLALAGEVVVAPISGKHTSGEEGTWKSQ